MNWYKRAQLRGEWWIIDSQAVFADSDIGDMGHEGYVIDSVKRKYAYDEFDHGDWVDWDGFKIQLAREELTEQYGEEIAEKLINKKDPKVEDAYLKKLKEMGITNDEYAIAEGIGDARAYGMKELGWKRVAGNSIQTQTLTRDDLKDIANGLWEAYDEEVEKSNFNIEVNANGRYYENVPYYLISDGAPSQLESYTSSYQYSKEIVHFVKNASQIQELKNIVKKIISGKHCWTSRELELYRNNSELIESMLKEEYQKRV